MTLYEHATRYIGIREIAGQADHPLILWWLSLCNITATHDETPWCSAFLNGMAWDLRLPRSKSAAARSWLQVGVPVWLTQATVGSDVVVLNRGEGEQPGPEVIHAPGHVGLFAGLESTNIVLLGGNQGDGVSLATFPTSRILGIRRLA